jgi:UPF0755 protein
VIDPLLPNPGRQSEDVRDWVEDPWDDPRTAARSGRFETHIEPVDRREAWPVVRMVVVLAAAVALVFGAGGMWYLRMVNPGGGDGVPQNFTVNEGETLEQLADRLQTEGFVSSASVFTWYVSRKGGLDVAPGYYQIVKRSHMGDVMASLATPPAATFVKVTFPEGFTAEQMGARLADRTLRLSAEQFVALSSSSDLETWLRGPRQPSLEGLLFPDTYQVSGEETESQVIGRMVALMERVGRQEGLDDSAGAVGLSPYETLIVASMIEREAKIADDRAKIARVIYNRLELGMRLQIDATLYYGAPVGASFVELKESDSPFNTYRFKGLPPTPIANPGRASIVAALNPAPNPPTGDPICTGVPRPCRYLYYVLSDKQGGHAFAATLEQHEQNVERSRQAGILP